MGPLDERKYGKVLEGPKMAFLIISNYIFIIMHA